MCLYLLTLNIPSFPPYSSVSIVDFKQVVVCWAACIISDTNWYNLTSSNFKLSCYSYIRLYSIVFSNWYIYYTVREDFFSEKKFVNFVNFIWILSISWNYIPMKKLYFAYENEFLWKNVFIRENEFLQKNCFSIICKNTQRIPSSHKIVFSTLSILVVIPRDSSILK